jgi:hypothetical protein
VQWISATPGDKYWFLSARLRREYQNKYKFIDINNQRQYSNEMKKTTHCKNSPSNRRNRGKIDTSTGAHEYIKDRSLS